MTAAVSGVPVPRSQKKSTGRRRFVAFGLAGVVVAAGVAGAVVTSSAYFTDEKTVATNTVSTNSISIALNNEQTTSALTAFAINNLAPYTTADLTALKAPMKVFNVKNSGTGDFNWTADIDTFSLKKTDGSDLPATTGSGSPSIDDAMAKIYVQFGAPTAINGSGVPTAVTWEPARTLTQTQDVANKEIATTLLAQGTAAVNKVVRFYMDPSVTNNYQNVKLSYTLRVNAEQPH